MRTRPGRGSLRCMDRVICKPPIKDRLYHEKYNSLLCWPRSREKGADMKEKTYEEHILSHLQRWGSITDVKAREYYGTNRCSEYIRRLREKGYAIETDYVWSKNRRGIKVRHGVYRYDKQ